MGLLGVNFWSRDIFFGFVGRPKDFFWVLTDRRGVREAERKAWVRFLARQQSVLTSKNV